MKGVGPVIGLEPDLVAVDRKAGAGDPPGIAADDSAEEVARIPRLVGGKVGQAERDIVDPPGAVRRFDGGDDPAIIEEANDEAVVAAQDIFPDGLAIPGGAVVTHVHSRCLRRAGQAERDDCQKGPSDHLCPPPP